MQDAVAMLPLCLYLSLYLTQVSTNHLLVLRYATTTAHRLGSPRPVASTSSITSLEIEPRSLIPRSCAAGVCTVDPNPEEALKAETPACVTRLSCLEPPQAGSDLDLERTDKN